METKSGLTNENLTKEFKSNFELVNYAIALAKNMIKTGRDPMLVLKEIEENKDNFTFERPATQKEVAKSKMHQEFIKTDVLEPELIVEEQEYIRNSSIFSTEEE